MSEKLTLAVDVAIESGSLSLRRGAQELDSLIFGKELSRSIDLLPETEKLLKRSGFQTSSIDLLAVSKSHGSLTGLRVGAASLLGLSSALGINVVEYDLLEIIANQKSANGGTQMIGLPVGRNSAEWLLTGGQQTKSFSTGREFVEFRSLIEKMEKIIGINSPQIFLHETLFEQFNKLNLGENSQIENLGQNMAYYLAIEAAKQ